jgi:ferredoxin
MLVINPDTCIDCGACETECPVNAIYQDGDVPADQQKFVEINERLAQKWPVLTVQREPLPTAEEFRNVKAKLDQLAE